jgi:hypothetical protein
MRLSLRFMLPLILVLAAMAYATMPLVDRLTLSWFVHDLDGRAELVANTLQEPLQEQLTAGAMNACSRSATARRPRARRWPRARCPRKSAATRCNAGRERTTTCCRAPRGRCT